MRAPASEIRVGLRPDIYDQIGADELAPVQETVTRGLDELLAELGLPGHSEVSLDPVASIARAVEVTINGWACRYPRGWDEDPGLLKGVLGLPLYAATGNLADLIAGCGDPDGAARILVALTRATVLRHANRLLTEPVVEQWSADMRLPKELVVGPLTLALQLGLPLRSHRGAAALWAEASEDGQMLAEDFVAALADGPWEMHIDSEYLRELAAEQTSSSTFDAVREHLYTDLGVGIPKLTFVEDPELPACGFALRAFGVSTPPVIGLAPGTVLTAVDSATAEIPQPAAVNPLTGDPATVVASNPEHYDDPYSVAPINLVAWALDRMARDRLEACINRISTDEELRRLGLVYPQLERALRQEIPVVLLARLRRRLVSDCAGTSDLRNLGQAVLDERVRGGASDEDELYRRVRQTLKSKISAAAAHGAGRVNAWRLPDALDGQVQELGASADATTRDSLAEFGATAMRSGDRNVALVTSPSIRGRVRELLADEFPSLPVLATDEIEAAAWHEAG